jgi:hypothetical protein
VKSSKYHHVDINPTANVQYNPQFVNCLVKLFMQKQKKRTLFSSFLSHLHDVVDLTRKTRVKCYQTNMSQGYKYHNLEKNIIFNIFILFKMYL